MKKIIFLMCVFTAMCMCSCTSSEMKDKKEQCQKICDDLSSYAELKTWAVIESKDTTWFEKRSMVTMAGKVPVYHQYRKQLKGCVLTIENGQKLLTSEYLHIPVGAFVVQQPIYVPESYKNNGKKDYRPSFKRYDHYILADGTNHPLKNFTLF